MTDTPVLVLLERTPDGELRPASGELVTAARSLVSDTSRAGGTSEAGDTPVTAVWVAGPGEAPVPVATLTALGALGVGVVHRVETADDPHLAPVVAAAVAAVLADAQSATVLLASTFENKDVAARLGVALRAGVVTDADAVHLQGGQVVAGKTVLAGTWTTTCAVTTPVALVALKLGAVPATEVPVGAGTGVEGTGADGRTATTRQVVEHTLAPVAAAAGVRVVSREARADSGRPDLAGARVVVVGGRGTQGDFGPLEELADLLGAAVGATRVATDEGWMDRETQIGQTGVSVSPRLYVGAGVSGAVHHRGGMQASGTVVAVNDDPDAPIFEIADYGVVGDLFDVIPQLTAELRRLRS